MRERALADSLRTRQGMVMVLALVAFLSVLLYLPTLEYGFVWDDTLLIRDNPVLAKSGLAQVLTRPFWFGTEDPGGPAASYYRPLASASFRLDYRLAGLNPGYFHFVNTVLAALCAVAVALIVWELLHSGVWAGLAGLIFAAHSSHVESVAFISGRTDLLASAFLSLAGFALIRLLRKRDFRWWPLVIFGFLLAMFSKETVILFPVLVLLAPLLTQTRYSRGYWLLAGGTVLVAVLYLVVRRLVLGGLMVPGHDLFQPFVVIANTFGLYIRMFFWPAAHQVKFPLDQSFTELTPYAIVALLFVVTLLVLAFRRRFWLTQFGYAWTILFLLPVTVASIGPQAAERLLYLPSAGLVVILTTLLSRTLHTRALLRRLSAVVLILAVAGMAFDTLRRSRIWRNEATLFSAMTREAPRAASGFANLAGAVREACPDSAIKLYNRAITLDQGYVDAHVNLGILYGQTGDHRQSVHHLRIADELRPGSAQILNNLGLAFLSAGEPESSFTYLDRAVLSAPDMARPYVSRSLALRVLGRDSAALSDLRTALALDPASAEPRMLLADHFEQSGRLDSAAGVLEPVAMTANATPALANRAGSLLVSLGDTTRAACYYDRALALDSNFVPALYNLAVLYSTEGDVRRAERLAARALRLRPDLEAVRQLHDKLARRNKPN